MIEVVYGEVQYILPRSVLGGAIGESSDTFCGQVAEQESIDLCPEHCAAHDQF